MNISNSTNNGTLPVKSETITSLELLTQINFFRNEIETKKEISHNDLLKVIRDEFEEEISLGNFSQSTYTNDRGREYPLFNLEISQAKQVLVRESKQVRKAVIQKLETLETQKPAQNPISIIEFALAELKAKEAQILALNTELTYKNDIILDIAQTVPAKTMRSTINQIIRSNTRDYQQRWTTLYKEFKYTFHKDLPTLFQNAVERCEFGKSKNILDYAERFEYLPDLYKLAIKLFETKTNNQLAIN